MAAPTGKKRMVDYNGIDLRIRARGKDKAAAAAAKVELRRRIGNLRGGVIPAWELEARGPEPTRWDVLA
jgi:hypothetical protein